MICETWCHKSIDNNQINLHDYNIIRNDRTSKSGKKSGGGLIVYAHQDLSVCEKCSVQNLRTIFRVHVSNINLQKYQTHIL